MTDDQIRRILQRLDEQDLTSKERAEAQFAVWKDLRREIKETKQKVEELAPVKQAFDSVMGADKVITWLLKFLASLGVGIGVIIGFIKWLKS